MLELKTLTDADFIPWLHAEARAYGNRLDHDPAVLRPHFDLARAIAVYDSDRNGAPGGSPGGAPGDGSAPGSPHMVDSPHIVGGAHSHLLEMSLPGGGAAPVAGVANVAVQPTHRRRGVMSMMMRHQLHDCHARGEPLAALFASESGIYGRFGYGIGSFHEQWRIDRHHTAYARPPDRNHDRAAAGQHIAFVDPTDILDELPEVFRRATAGRPAVFQRARHHWQQDADAPEHRQGGPGGLFYAACRNDAGHIEGYAVYRTRRPVVIVQELMTTTVAAAAALWRFCFDTDLMETTEALKRPLDDPLPWLLADPRRLQRTTRDGLWLRIIDARHALPLRRYAAPGRLTLQIQDDLCPWNNTPLTLETTSDADAASRATDTGAGCHPTGRAPDANLGADAADCHPTDHATDTGASAECRPTRIAPEITITVSALASVYLGAATFTTLARAGLAEEHTPGTLQKADRMFAVTLQPWTPYNF